MEKAVEILLTDVILSEFFERFSLEDDKLKKLGDFENYVFEVFHEGEARILRLTHSTHRNEKEISAELDWMNFLNNQGVNVPKAFPSNNELYVESIVAADGSEFYASVFSKAPGTAIKTSAPQFNEQLFHAWGKEMGKMHAATKKYELKRGLTKRATWEEEDLLTNIEQYIPAGDTLILTKTRELMETLHSFPKNNNNFGLIHTDIHSGNFFFDGKEVHVFDFDDSCYHWFASDIAIPLYYSLFFGLPNSTITEKIAFTEKFVPAFLEGYETENPLPENWKEHLPYFLKLRDVTLYSVFHKKIAPEDRNETIISFIKEIKGRIENDEAIVSL